ncbi:VOC family protein [Ilumatobacter coccineus]|jgi:catechol 2,3-dioxygenase-like lactoylglutathione lyase family enzyme|uniref:VOC domain-containing protein n=1 Tax=Ilumatobacter coccineus (strain NBRC 103263 / KCTC 29153 / YM16-304) TaxID=1313172 RepID=A0A6C7E509_ILUCY|nr:VOC family protein [Ilumatobacter coccineus]BAN01671.1 hypothetical protein YM304_13570 [Ilumatobacter coccineus YM16-304]
MIRGIHHVAISTPDIDRLAAFYRDGLGFEEVMSTSWADRPMIDQLINVPGSAARQLMLRAANCYIELFEYSAPTPVPQDPAYPPSNHGITHFCFDIVDIDAEYERLTGLGMTFHRAPPTSEELGSASPLRAIYGRDPDGNIIELQEVLDPSIPFSLEQTELAGPTLRDRS